MREARSEIFEHKFTVQTCKYLLACFIPSRKVLLHIILYILLHAYVGRLKAAFHTILLSQYLCVKLEAEFSTINLRSKHSNTCLHVSFHPGKACSILFYIYTSDMSTSSSISFNTIVPVPVSEGRIGIFVNKITVQTLKYLLACFIPPRKLLLHIILYIHLHAYVCRLRAAFHTILLSMYLCEKLEAEFSTINLRSKHSNTCLHVSFHPEKSCCILFYIYTCMRTCVVLKQHFIQYCCACTCG